jgi:hypothetical protein
MTSFVEVLNTAHTCKGMPCLPAEQIRQAQVATALRQANACRCYCVCAPTAAATAAVSWLMLQTSTLRAAPSVRWWRTRPWSQSWHTTQPRCVQLMCMICMMACLQLPVSGGCWLSLGKAAVHRSVEAAASATLAFSAQQLRVWPSMSRIASDLLLETAWLVKCCQKQRSLQMHRSVTGIPASQLLDHPRH